MRTDQWKKTRELRMLKDDDLECPTAGLGCKQQTRSYTINPVTDGEITLRMWMKRGTTDAEGRD